MTGTMRVFIIYQYFEKHLRVVEEVNLKFDDSIHSDKTVGTVIHFTF
jgi:hypothetical protein